ncbi:hypothetical protein ABT369_05360 [Dactylosporangium sp. NPDC000244]|uniref:hypothetical protein n=1 Tax=Dactylosporangium sp. NPDC000244 TaxID=3154365 RepID=UPI00332D6D1B
MAGNSIKLTFAGDADALSKAAKQAEKATADVADAAGKSGKELADAAKSSSDLGAKMGHLGSAVSGANDAIDAIGGSLDAVNQLQQAGAERASRLARATDDILSAQLDYNEALQDGKRAQLDIAQASIDLETAQLDAAEAQTAYNKAVKEHGAGSMEAKRAMLALKQANQDVTVAQADATEAANDAARAVSDAKGAQLDLNDAMREAHPPEMQKWAENLQMVSPLITALVGVVGLATGAQWLFNAALWASPITWIVLAIAALVAIIVIVATKTTFFQDTWKAVWGFLKDVGAWFAGPFADFFVKGFRIVMDYFGNLWTYIKSIPGQLKSVFSQVTDYIFAPFRAAFNLVSSAWNGTIGRLHWTVPSWVPGVGGNSISAPTLPKFHQGGVVGGGLGSEVLAVLQAGERVTPAGGGSHAEGSVVLTAGDDFGRFVLKVIREQVGLRGGDPVRVLRGTRD